MKKKMFEVCVATVIFSQHKKIAIKCNIFMVHIHCPVSTKRTATTTYYILVIAASHSDFISLCNAFYALKYPTSLKSAVHNNYLGNCFN